LELGCGVSLHSLRMEVELLMTINSEDQDVMNIENQQEQIKEENIEHSHNKFRASLSVIRINPTSYTFTPSSSTSSSSSSSSSTSTSTLSTSSFSSQPQKPAPTTNTTTKEEFLAVKNGTILKLGGNTVCVGLGMGSMQSLEEIGKILTLNISHNS